MDNAGKFYLDTHSLDALRLQAEKNPKQALPAVAKQFESVLMSMMLKSMRDATPQDGLFDSEQTKMYTSMLDQQLVQTLSGKGMGLAEMMVKQLSPRLPDAAVKPASVPMPQAVYSQPVAPQPAEAPAPSASAQDFVTRLLAEAKSVEKDTGISAKFLIGQAALETGWGKHVVKSANGRSSHNLFGIKAGASWKGPVVTALTTEYVNGMPQKIYQNFRSYSSEAESIRDYANLLSNDPRYGNALASSKDPAGFAQALQDAGYATDPNYAEKLVRMFGENPLNQAG
ncbi:MAG: flagellar assembly peptidoglycan hydrolase FlgJ [Burkholderiales bacterium]|nr:flagellar assembly peptidoglycan hydrolase FlgJ [Burkholderiales bacterium]